VTQSVDIPIDVKVRQIKAVFALVFLEVFCCP